MMIDEQNVFFVMMETFRACLAQYMDSPSFKFRRSSMSTYDF